MSDSTPRDPIHAADQIMAVEVFSQVLAATDASQLGEKLTEQLRELTGARTVMVITHGDEPHAHELLRVCPIRRKTLFSAADLELLCPENAPAPLPCLVADIPPNHPLRALLLGLGIESLLRVPLHAGSRLVGMLLLLDLPALERIDEMDRIVTHLSPVLALALRNALAHRRIEQQAQQLDAQTRELEQRVAERTTELQSANETLETSRLAAFNLMEDAVAAREHADQTTAALQQEVVERKQAEEELRKYKDQLEETVQRRTDELRQARDNADLANKAKSTFLANMSHELRTPLNAILGFSQLMYKDRSLSASQRENLEIINNSGDHLLRLINDVLEIAKIEAGKLQLEIATFDLHDLVREVSDMMKLRAHQKGLQLELDQSSDFLRYIKGDEARLRQILVNLISNAVKFTEQGGVTIRLRSKENAQHHLLIEVEDTGPGISKKDQRQLFKPFERLADAKFHEGTGLGLAIVHQFVQLMEGSVSIKSEPGKGSLFRVDLPLPKAAQAEMIILSGGRHGAAAGLAPGQPSRRILIAEDQRDNQILLSRLMDELGLETKVVENGEECVQVFKKWKPDLIWMDRRMPVMDGVEATRRIRELPGGDKVKIVAVTASALKEEETELRAAGMDDYVSKPYYFGEIYDCLESQLGLKSLYSNEIPERESPPTTLSSEMLAELDDELRVTLHEALDSLNSELIGEVIRRIGEKDRTLARLLKNLTDNYDYPTVLNALDSLKPSADDGV